MEKSDLVKIKVQLINARLINKEVSRQNGQEEPTSREDLISKRDNFWKSFNFLEGYGDRQREPSPLESEYWFKQNFGKALKKLLENYVFGTVPKEISESTHSDGVIRIHSKPQDISLYGYLSKLLGGVIFDIEILDYSSMDFNLIIGGVQNLSKLFDNNFSVFEVFFSSYIPLAFIATMYQRFGRGQEPMVEAQVAIPESVLRMFQSIDENEENQTDFWNRAQHKANWMWIVSNTTLVVPILIAALVLYFAFQGLSAE